MKRNCDQSVRQVDGPYFVGATSHDQSTVFAVPFQLGVRVTVMPEVPTMPELPDRKMVPLTLTIASPILPADWMVMPVPELAMPFRFCAASVTAVRAELAPKINSETFARMV